jgi:hypothetical protein
MSPANTEQDGDPEIVALSSVIKSLKDLEPGVQIRVLRYAAEKLGIRLGPSETSRREAPESSGSSGAGAQEADQTLGDSSAADERDGVSSVALKWMKRSGITGAAMSQFFCVGGDEIDFVAEKVPGTSKRERMHNVILLKSIAAYLAGGVARVSYEQVKEACLHYNAFDSANFAANLKSFSAEGRRQ